MDEEKKPYIVNSADEAPIRIPSVEEAWPLMKEKLDERMPVRGWYWIFRKPGFWVVIGVLFIGSMVGFGISRQQAHKGVREKGVAARNGVGDSGARGAGEGGVGETGGSGGLAGGTGTARGSGIGSAGGSGDGATDSIVGREGVGADSGNGGASGGVGGVREVGGLAGGTDAARGSGVNAAGGSGDGAAGGRRFGAADSIGAKKDIGVRNGLGAGNAGGGNGGVGGGVRGGRGLTGGAGGGVKGVGGLAGGTGAAGGSGSGAARGSEAKAGKNGKHAIWGNRAAGKGRHAVWSNGAVRNGKHARWGNGTADAKRRHASWGNGSAAAKGKHSTWDNGNAAMSGKHRRNGGDGGIENDKLAGNGKEGMEKIGQMGGRNRAGMSDKTGMSNGKGMSARQGIRIGGGMGKVGLAKTKEGSPKFVPVADSMLRAAQAAQQAAKLAAAQAAAKQAALLAAAKAAAKTAKAKKDSARGWSGISMSAGLSLGQDFALGQQQATSYSSNGKNNILTDYIPAPYFRFFGGDRWYLEINPRFFSPQYTKSQLIDSSARDSSNIPGWTAFQQRNSVTLKKLFYTDIPLTFHYRVFDGLYLGAGIQYSRLLGAAGLEQINMHLGSTDSLYSSKVTGLKGDSLGYRKLSASEWRFLLEADYKWRRFTFGLRYEQALKPYLPQQLNGSKGTDKNASFSIHVYYDLWEKMRK